MKKRFVLVICPVLAGITLPLYLFKEVENISKNDDTIFSLKGSKVRKFDRVPP
jgi:hypothetical protein